VRINVRNFIKNLPHIHIGIKLHFNYLRAYLTGEIRRLDHCIAFPDIDEGLRALKRVKSPCVAVPVPDEIKEECGIAILCDEESLRKTLRELKDVRILGVYRRKEGKFTERVSP